MVARAVAVGELSHLDDHKLLCPECRYSWLSKRITLRPWMISVAVFLGRIIRLRRVSRSALVNLSQFPVQRCCNPCHFWYKASTDVAQSQNDLRSVICDACFKSLIVSIVCVILPVAQVEWCNLVSWQYLRRIQASLIFVTNPASQSTVKTCFTSLIWASTLFENFTIAARWTNAKCQWTEHKTTSIVC